ncbi:MAG: bZIP transcription factor, partial [Chloroflexota bacterium]
KYPLMPLSELERSIEEHGHLPGIPSAAQVAERGINVGQMQARLLEKVEELTLYVIEINKQLDGVKRENDLLKGRLFALEGGR